jgi:hypothetical protein
MVWMKGRNNINNNYLYDTVRGVSSGLVSNTTNAAADYQALSAFNSNGFTDSFGFTSSETAASWTFRKQPKFFDVVTWSGDGTGDREISHNLGVAPGCILLKSTSTGGTNWFVYHRALSTPDYRYMYLQDTAAANTSGSNLWNVTSTTFRASSTLDANNNGQTFVAYLFAHDAGGFGLTGTDNVISCGSYTEGGVGTEQTINLGYEAQWLLIKPSSVTGSWYIYDVMRGFAQTVNNYLLTNSANAEASTNSYLFKPAATGFIAPGDLFGSSANVIYIAIRRGPMKVPTLGTSVFSPNASSGSTGTALVTNFPVDLSLSTIRSGDVYCFASDRLRGVN